jgi:REP element-mobilizing transposase RayT
MREACAELRELNVEAGHVHLLVHYPSKAAPSRLAGSHKGVSARRLRQEFPGHIRTYLRSDTSGPLVRRRVLRRRAARDHQGIDRAAHTTRLDLDRCDSSRARGPRVPHITY